MWWRFLRRFREPVPDRVEIEPDDEQRKPREPLLDLQRVVGNRAVRRFLHGAYPNRVVDGGPASLLAEREADRLGERVAEARPVRARRAEDPASRSRGPRGAPGRGGEPLPDSVRAPIEGIVREDLRDVRIHADAPAAEAADALGAEAFVSGNDIAFARDRWRPETIEGRKLLGHEIAHVLQQRGIGPGRGRTPGPGDSRSTGPASSEASQRFAPAPAIQRKIRPEDVAREMLGREFRLTSSFTSPFGNLKAGTIVTVLLWDNAKDTVLVWSEDTTPRAMPFDVPKRLLEPVVRKVAGIHLYHAGVPGRSTLPGQARTVSRREKELADWKARESSYRKKRALWVAEFARRKDLLARSRDALNRMLIEETMYNRFDGAIEREVDAANRKHGLRGKDALHPNIVKSMIFQESQMGTAGEHLEAAPTWPVRSRFNIGQVIDSSGSALLALMEAEHPDLIKAFSLTDLRTELAAAKRERKRLRSKRTRTEEEDERLAELDLLHELPRRLGSWEPFIWKYRKAGKAVGFNEAVGALCRSASPELHLDYEFWIHLAVFWLFEKRTAGRTWEDAVRAYNGSGARAKHYREAVVKRSEDAADAAGKGKHFIPVRKP